MERSLSLTWLAVKEQQTTQINLKNRRESMALKSIRVYSLSKSALELWIKIKTTLLLEAAN
jgi:hypothetical protein